MITIKARNSLGLLPELNRAAVPAEQLSKVQERLDALVQVAYTSGPASVIDRARDAAQLCLAVWLATEQSDAKLLTKDLGELASKLPQEHHVRQAIARIIARLHSRVKPNEIERYATRPVTEADGEFALAAVGLLLRELNWAK
ncbi:MAG: hypothetical protein L0Z53_01825 [Acidobacteriales bacterium]|nr:hypothetical protein [Terriglobales bacterium]